MDSSNRWFRYQVSNLRGQYECCMYAIRVPGLYSIAKPTRARRSLASDLLLVCSTSAEASNNMHCLRTKRRQTVLSLVEVFVSHLPSSIAVSANGSNQPYTSTGKDDDAFTVFEARYRRSERSLPARHAALEAVTSPELAKAPAKSSRLRHRHTTPY